MIKYILISIALLFYLGYTFKACKNILKTILLNKKQKGLNLIMTLLVPFFWYQIIKDLITDDSSVMTKTKRNKLIKKTSGGFYESGKGITG